MGVDEAANPVVREWGDKPDISETKDHIGLALQHGLINWDDGTRVAGSGFVVYRGMGARLVQRQLEKTLATIRTDH